MKSSILYIALGFFIIVLVGITELKYLINITNQFISYVEEIDSYQDIDKKAEEIENFREKWEKHKKILSVLIDHQDIHKIESILVEIETILENNLDSSQISTNFALLKLYIEDIKDERTFILQNVL